MSGSITYKSVKDLMEESCKFEVPAYQRGYKWDARDAEALLDDIRNYFQLQAVKDAGNNAIYCVQPAVVREKDGKYIVVDGQQRLTTIYLILKYIRQNYGETLKKVYWGESGDAGEVPEYSISYETRDGSADFIKRLGPDVSEDEVNKNIDFYHMDIVYKAAGGWFEENFEAGTKKINLEVFIRDFIERVCFIWYPVMKSEETEVFRRLNIGKIPLTDSELIRAKFLDRANGLDDQAREKISRDWYEMESTLQNDEFWLFIHGTDYDRPARIDYIFEIICRQDLLTEGENESKDAGQDRHPTFRYFNEALTACASDPKKIEETVWKKVRDIYRIFVEWYNDYRLFHYIGYLVACNEAVKDGDTTKCICSCLDKWNKTKDKNEFIRELRKDIADGLKKDIGKYTGFYNDDTNHNFIGKLIENEGDIRSIIRKQAAAKEKQAAAKEKRAAASEKRADAWTLADYLKAIRFEELEYGNYSKRCCVNILLLHNIETIIQYNDRLVRNETYGVPHFSRFPFHLYALERWDVEHIRSKSGDKDDNKERIIYMLLAVKYLGITPDESLFELMEKYMSDSKEFEKKKKSEGLSDDDLPAETEALQKDYGSIREKIDEIGCEALPYEDRNGIFNYTLLDRGTNREYKNHVFPYKRAYIAEKEKGIKLIFDIEENEESGSGDLPYKAVEVESRRQDLIKMLLAYAETDDEELKKEMQTYIGSFSGEFYERKKNVPKPDVELTQADVSGYSAEYLKSDERDKHEGLKYRLAKRPETTPFVPLVTKNIFTKYYSTKISTMMQWTKEDAEDYWEDISGKLKYYFDLLNKDMKQHNAGGDTDEG